MSGQVFALILLFICTSALQRSQAQSLAGGFGQTCALLDDGSVKCWGRNDLGQLGLGDAEWRGDDPKEMGDLLPQIDLGTGRTAVSVAAGYHYSCALLDDGSVKCWGYNHFGQLGQGDKSSRGDNPNEMGNNLPPVDLGTGAMPVAISAGASYNCVLLDDQSVKCWGANWHGQLGLGDLDWRGDDPNEMGNSLPAVDLGTGRTVVAVVSGNDHSCALFDDGSVKCWGRNSFGQLGLGDANDRGDNPNEMGNNLPPINLGTGRTSVAIAAGGDYTCALLDDGSLKCWGRNNFGQLGLGDTNNRGDNPSEMGNNLPPINLGTGRTAVSVATGNWHICARLDDESVKCWGHNFSGQLGLGDAVQRGGGPNEMGNRLPPVDLGTGRTAVTINAGGSHTCALLDDQSVKCWGNNGYGQLGIGDSRNRGDHTNEMGDALPPVKITGDMSPPECRIDAVNDGPPTSLDIYIRDANPGVRSIAVLKNKNAHVEIVKGSGFFYTAGDVATFNLPITDDILISATKIDQNAHSNVVVKVTDANGNETKCDPVVTTLAGETPASFRLDVNYPNPFNPVTIVPFAVAESGPVMLVVYDAVGREVVALVEDDMMPGMYHATWDGRNADGSAAPSGIYFYRMTAGSFSSTRSMVMLR